MTPSPPLNPQAPHSSNIDRSSGPSSQRPQQPAWGPSQQSGVRRGLTPISTSFNSISARTSNSSQSPRNLERNPWSPSLTSNYSTLATASGRQSIRSPSVQPNTSSFSPPPLGQQQAHSSALLPSGRTRAIASSAYPQSASAAAATQGSGVGGSSSGGGVKSFRASPSIPPSASFGLPSTSIGISTSGRSAEVSKIVIAQLFLLLSTLNKDEKDKSKWDTTADNIRKVCLSFPCFRLFLY